MTSPAVTFRRRRGLDRRVLRDAAAVALITVGLVLLNVAGFALAPWAGVATLAVSMIFVGVLLGLDDRRTAVDRG